MWSIGAVLLKLHVWHSMLDTSGKIRVSMSDRGVVITCRFPDLRAGTHSIRNSKRLGTRTAFLTGSSGATSAIKRSTSP